MTLWTMRIGLVLGAISGKIQFMEPTTTQSQSESNEAMDSPPRDRVRIVSTPGTCGGRPRIDGHRITVEDVAIWHERMGMSPDVIVSSYPTITLSDVHAAIAYYCENRERIDADIEGGRKFVEEMRAKAGPSRLQALLEARKTNGSDDSLPPR
jgi:uncharacterized protein (DUF433 family)